MEVKADRWQPHLALTGLRCSMATLSMSVMKLGAVTPLNFPIVRCSITRAFRPGLAATPP